MQLGRIDGCSRGVKFLLPLLVMAVFWWLATWLLRGCKSFPRPFPQTHRIEAR